MPVMSPERPPSQNSGGGNNVIEPTNMVLSTIPLESGHVVIHQPNARTHQQQQQQQHHLTKTIASSTTSSPSKYVVIHQNGNGQYRTSDGTTAYLTAQSNGVGNIVLLATEPMEVSSSDQNLIVNTNGSDEELTSLTWLHDKNLIKGIVACTNGKTTTVTSPTRQSNSGGPLSPTSDFLEDSSVSEDNASSANSSSDQGISINNVEYSPTTSNGNFASYQHNQYHPVVTTTNNNHQVQYINNNSLTKNRNHLLSPTKTTITTAVPAAAYTTVATVQQQHLNIPKTLLYNGPSGTTTVVEYKAGTNFNPSPTRPIPSQIQLSPQRSPPPQQPSPSTTVTISSTTSQTSSPTQSSTAAAAHHQHFHKKYLREQMNGNETSSLMNSGNEVAVEYQTLQTTNQQQQQPQQQFYSSAIIEGEEYHRTPIKTETISYTSSNEDMLISRESLNFDSPGATGNGRSINGSAQKAPSSTTSSAAASPKQKHPTNVPYDPMVHTTNKPPYSFSSLIFMAIEDSLEKALPVKEIYAWIVQHFPYFKTAPTGWKNSVRHNLSLNKSFLKVEKAPNMGKGSLWRVEQQQRHNLLQALARSPFHQCSAVDKFSPYKTNPSTPRPADSPPTTPIKSNLDPELFPKLWKTINDMGNKGVNGSSSERTIERDDCHSQFIYSSNNGSREFGGVVGDELPIGNGMIVYSIERLARDCGADSIDDVHAATAMLALKHGPNVFSEHFPNGSPVITSSPSEDHTYSAGGGAVGSAGSSTAHSQNGSENGACSDTAYESCDERNHRNITAEELEEQRRHAEGVDALLSFASSAASSPAKRPPSTSIEDEHISSYMENIPHFGTSQNGAKTTIITHEDSESILYHQRSSSYETQSYYHHLTLPSSAKKLKPSRSIRTKLKKKTTLMR